jgi:hypothetical protein
MFCRISMQMCVHDVFVMKFMILLSFLTSLVDVTHQIFANMVCMILLLILPLELVLLRYAGDNHFLDTLLREP